MYGGKKKSDGKKNTGDYLVTQMVFDQIKQANIFLVGI